MKKQVGIGFLGSTLDFGGNREERWKRWRPTVAACWQETLPLDEYHLIYQIRFKPLLDQIVADIAHISPKTEVVLHQIEFEDAWDFAEVFSKLHDFSNQFNFELDSKDYYINITTGTHVVQICLFLLAESQHMPGKLLQINATKRGDTKGSYRIIDLDLKNYDPIASRFNKEKVESEQFLKAGIATKNVDFNKLIEQIEVIALRSKDPILLMGKSGVGKTELARRIYQLKQLKHKIQGPFVEVNCATLKGDSVMSTLFGHKKGSYTGALKDRAGLLKEADGGLIFLDEIGELGLDEQAMLLRAIEDKKFLPLGSDKEVTSHFQLIAGTNRDLLSEVRGGRFREDLFNRINLWNFRLPSLKERKEDIKPNLDFELSKFSSKNGKKIRFTSEAESEFLKFALKPQSTWDGNFRDLNAAISRLGILSDSGRIDSTLIKDEIQRLENGWSKSATTEEKIAESLLGEKIHSLDPFDLVQLEKVLQVCRVSRSLSEAGRILFSVSRLKKSAGNDSDRLKKYIERFGLTAKEVLMPTPY